MFKIPEAPDIDPAFARRIYFIILLFSLFWSLLIILPPLLYSSGMEELSSLIYLSFSPVCHQEEARSFTLAGNQLAVCSRCTMIYLGFLAGAVIYPFVRRVSNINAPSLWFLLIPLAALGTDVILDRTGIVSNTFVSRSVTGLIMGIGLSLFIIPGFIRFFYEISTFFGSKARAGF